MEVILKQDVDKLGKAGTSVKVKEGFARNFLIPNGLAVPVTPANLKKLQQENALKLQGLEKIKKSAQELQNKLAGLSLTISAQAQEENKLYGSVTVQDIASALNEEGFQIDKTAILLSEPIRALGIYEVPLRLHPEISANIKVWVVKK